MSFKQIIKLISRAIIFILITSAIIMVLPPQATGLSIGKPLSLSSIEFGESKTDLFNVLLQKLNSVVQFKDTNGNKIKLDIDIMDLVDNLSENKEVTVTENVIFLDADYYRLAEDQTGQALKNTLNDIIEGHTEFSYKEVWDALKNIDEDPNDESNVILIYTGKSIPKEDNGTDVDGWNREHVWAKSHGDFGTSMGAGTDLHHVRPADVTVNSSRNNKNFDDSENAHSEAIGSRHDKDSFEPRDAVKGDIARMMFYMAVRYEGENGEPDLELVEYMNEGKSPFHGKLSTLIEWHKEDPVSDWERRRNNIIHKNYQGNRNPFIDHPEWVDEIWKSAS